MLRDTKARAALSPVLGGSLFCTDGRGLSFPGTAVTAVNCARVLVKQNLNGKRERSTGLQSC